MNNVMLDLETFGNGPRPVIVAIGATFFDEERLGESFYVRVSPQSCVNLGLEMDTSTVLWWMRQKDDARAELAKPDVGILTALELFDSFLRSAGQGKVQMWGNGAAADNVWLASAYRAAHVAIPWDFWGDRCYRTIKSTPAGLAVPLARTGTHHNALDDAKTQAQHLIEIWKSEKTDAQYRAGRVSDLVLCLERCRAAIEHRGEQPVEALDEALSQAMRTLDAHRGCITDAAYWDRVRAYAEPCMLVVAP